MGSLVVKDILFQGEVENFHRAGFWGSPFFLIIRIEKQFHYVVQRIMLSNGKFDLWFSLCFLCGLFDYDSVSMESISFTKQSGR